MQWRICIQQQLLQNTSESYNSLFIFSLYVFAKKKAIFSSSSLLLTTVNERLISSLSTEACIEKQSICEHKFTKHREKKTFFIKEEITALFFISKHFLLLLFQRNIYLYCMNFMPSGLLLTSIYAKTRRKTGISAHERAKTSLKILPPLTKLLLQYCKNHQKEMIDTITCYYWYSREETIQKPGT